MGSFFNRPSPSGTFDQGGNVFEWNEEIVNTPDRGIRGGWFNSGPTDMAASTRGATFAEQESIGFRVAMVPEPSTALLLASGLAALAVGRRRMSG